MNIALPCEIKKEPNNRQERRKAENELKRILPRINEIEDNFIAYLFGDNDASYKELYEFYSEQYIKLITWMEERRMFKYTIPNHDYFMINFKPVDEVTKTELSLWKLLNQ